MKPVTATVAAAVPTAVLLPVPVPSPGSRFPFLILRFLFQTRCVVALNVLSCSHFICNATRHKVQVNTTKTLAEVATATSPQSQSSQCMPLSVPDETFRAKFSTKANIFLYLTHTRTHTGTHAHIDIHTYAHACSMFEASAWFYAKFVELHKLHSNL